MMSVYPLTTSLDLRLAREFSEFSKFGPPKWGYHHWTIGVVSPTRRHPGMRQYKSSIPHVHPQEKGCGRSANELMQLSQESFPNKNSRHVLSKGQAGRGRERCGAACPSRTPAGKHFQ
ncbi:hypothetical protein EVAR_11156_1 [Eumeta japonica]|uniref:Uncharacterized protein n=1 Tax=Eumeta variegata TaxID=151549 RepID=A0A4C1U409_EUMVA|nr:hypothetical protein EVAR_11156_1 [Eumeta japonica]